MYVSTLLPIIQPDIVCPGFPAYMYSSSTYITQLIIVMKLSSYIDYIPYQLHRKLSNKINNNITCIISDNLSPNIYDQENLSESMKIVMIID